MANLDRTYKLLGVISAICSTVMVVCIGGIGYSIGESLHSDDVQREAPTCYRGDWGSPQAVDELAHRLSRGTPASACDIEHLGVISGELAWLWELEKDCQGAVADVIECEEGLAEADGHALGTLLSSALYDLQRCARVSKP